MNKELSNSYKWEVFSFVERVPTRPFIQKFPMEMEFMDKDYQVFKFDTEKLKLVFLYQTSPL